MADSRSRLIVFLLLSVAHATATDRLVPILALVTVLIVLFHYEPFKRGAAVVVATVISLSVFQLLVYASGAGLSTGEIALGLMRWVSLAVVTVTLFLSINALEIISSLVYFRLPYPIALALGIGLRFLPTVLEEAERLNLVRRQYRLTLRTAVRRFGFVGAIDRFLSPLLVSVLRRVDSLLISIRLQQLDQRVLNFSFARWRTSDIIWVASAVALVVTTFYR